ncbi:hypothetical protein B0H14DRAFT_2840337 [Mycena olivaceomarginata]|nr:hypothetical protein B0H14DRAFT_2840337 [Mycena olivaceomarginata]
MSALEPLVAHVLRAVSAAHARPLFDRENHILSALLVTQLRSHSLNVALLSLDDIYLPHAGLVSLAETHPDNTLWRGRGQPGTHDVSLGLQVLTQLKEGKSVEIPRFEKSLFDGEGDRLPAGSEDIVIFEGWCVGFYPVSLDELDARWDGAWAEERQRLRMDDSVRKQDVLDANEALKNYIPMWDFFDIFVQLQPSPSAAQSPLSVIYTWRLEQEHHMKARNGGKGMSDAGVKAFVDRYIPGYVFFGDGPAIGFGALTPRWIGNSLRIHIDNNRVVVGTEVF